MGLLTACDSEVTVYVVTSSADAPAADPGDGVCETATPGECTLRAAVMEANATEGRVRIDIGDDNVYLLTVAGAGEDAGASGDLDITHDDIITVNGRSTIDGGGLDRVIDLHEGRLQVHGATITGGAATAGAGIRVADGAELSLLGAEVRDNTSSGGGGGIHSGDAEVAVRFSSIVDNVGGTAGGIRTTGALVVENATVSSNTATSGAGGVGVEGPASARIDWSTVTANSGGVGGVDGPVGMAGSAVGDQASGADCGSAVASSGYNADSDGSCVDGSVSGDLPSAAMALGPLTTEVTSFHLPEAGSALIGAVPEGSVGCGIGVAGYDQRFTERPSPSIGAGACAIGSVEVVRHFVVTHGGDDVAANPGDGVCQDASGPPGACSLRAAIDEANATGGGATIELTADVTLSRDVGPGPTNPGDPNPGDREDQNFSGDLDVWAPIVLEGNDHTIDGAQIDRVFDVHDGSLEIRNATVTNGRAKVLPEFLEPEDTSRADGGAIRARAPLTLDHVTIVGNRADGELSFSDGFGVERGGRGGGVATFDTTLTIRDSTVRDNTTTLPGRGGGVSVEGGTLTVVDSDISENSSSDGGGLHLEAPDEATVTGSWFEGNEVRAAGFGSGTGGAIATKDVLFTLSDSVIVGNLAVGSNGGALHVTGPPPSGFFPPSPRIDRTTITDNLATTISWSEQADPTGGRGAAIWSNRQVLVDRSTVADNHGRRMLEGPFSARGSIFFSGGAQDNDCFFAASISGQYNLGSCGFGSHPSNLPGVNPLLGVAGVGGPAGERVPHANSPAVAAIPAGTSVCEQATPCNIGASQSVLGYPAEPRTYVVDDPGDGPAVTPGDGVCSTAGGTCTLRAALQEANAHPAADSIVVNTDVTLSVASDGDPRSATGNLVAASDVHLVGNGHTVDAAGVGRVLDHRAGSVRIDGLTLTGGRLDVPPFTRLASGYQGAGIRSQGGGSLRLVEATLVDNSGGGTLVCCGGGEAYPALGGGLYVDGPGPVDIERSLVTGNWVRGVGTGHALFALRAEVNIADSTFTDNTGASATNGAALVWGSGGGGMLSGTTIAETHNAIHTQGDVALGMRGSILASAGPVCIGQVWPAGYNLASDSSCGLGAGTNQQGVDPQLGPLADNGGPTLTRLPAAGAPGVEAIPSGTALLCVGDRTDQRGVPRPQAAGCDIGAVERQALDP